MRINVMQFCILALLLGLLGASVGLGTHRLDLFFYSEKEWSHLAMDETSGMVYLVLCFPSNKSATKPQLLLCVALTILHVHYAHLSHNYSVFFLVIWQSRIPRTVIANDC